MHRGELREFLDDVVRRMEQDAGVGFAQHGGVVVGIARRDHAVVQALQRDDRLALGILLAQLVIDDPIVVVDDQLVAQQRGEAQLAHQRLRELVEGVRQDHHLETLAQPVDELDGTVQRLEGRDHLLDVRQFQAMLIEDAQALLHQHIVIGNVACGGPQRFDSGSLGKGNPDLRNQDTFQVETGYFHGPLLTAAKMKPAL